MIKKSVGYEIKFDDSLNKKGLGIYYIDMKQTILETNYNAI